MNTNLMQKITEEQIDHIRQYDALEIGAHNGGTTKIMSPSFKRIFVIDPWDGRQQGNEEVYKEFLETTRDCTNIDYLRSGSETPQSISYLRNIEDLKLGFVFIDGLHTKEAVINDFFLSQPYIQEGGIIMIDDTNHHPVNQGADFVNRISTTYGFTEIFPSYLVVNSLIGRNWNEDNIYSNQIWVRCFMKNKTENSSQS